MNTTTNRQSRASSNLSSRSSSNSRNSNPKRKFSRPSSKSPSGGRFLGGNLRHRRNNNSGGNFSGGRRGGGGRKMPTFNPSQFINTNPVEKAVETYEAKNRFDTFGLNKNFVSTIDSMGLKIPSPIQDQIIPEILNGRDVIGLAETGTGKTAAFLIPLIEKTIQNNKRETLILAPTRELAIQIEEEFKKLSKNLRIFSVVCVGGINIRPQIRALRRRNHFIIATPGRILDLIKRNDFDPTNISAIVLDEADRMLDMGFIPDMRAILSKTPKNRETLFFSATMTKDADKLCKDFLNNPITISVKKKDITDSIAQDVVRFEKQTKFSTLLNLLSNPEFKRVIIFGSMKHSVEKLAKQLTQNGVLAESIHGNKNHSARVRALSKFKSGKARVLVATDVAARGIHIDNVSHVINYDLPGTFEDYVHRIGRTGRAEKRGQALTFVTS